MRTAIVWLALTATASAELYMVDAAFDEGQTLRGVIDSETSFWQIEFDGRLDLAFDSALDRSWGSMQYFPGDELEIVLRYWEYDPEWTQDDDLIIDAVEAYFSNDRPRFSNAKTDMPLGHEETVYSGGNVDSLIWPAVIGDVTFDRIFNSKDLMAVFEAGEYEDAVDGNSLWMEGDWDLDRDFTTSDLVYAMERTGYSHVAVPVPEPVYHTAVLAAIFVVIFAAVCRESFREN